MPLARLASALSVFGVAATLAAAAHAQQFPSKPVKILVGFPPATVTDGLARLYGQKLAELLNTPVIVDNKPGGSNLVAIRALQMSPPDGHTLFAGVGSALAQGPAIRKDLPYDPLKDLSLIGFLGTSAGAIYVHPEVPVRSIAELIAQAKSQPGKLSYATGGVGSAGHLQAEYFMSVTQAKMFHVPYKSDQDAAREVLAGAVQVGFTNARAVASLASAGKVRALAITDSRRLPQLPNTPTIIESGVTGLDGLIPYTFFGLAGPGGMPPAIVNRVNEALNKVSAMPDVASQLREQMFIEPGAGSPAEFRRFIEKEMAKWRELGKTVQLTE